MKNAVVYLLALAIATSPIIIIPACTKKSSTTGDLIGNWAISDYFDGPARSEAVTFTINDTVFVGTGVNGGTNMKTLNDFWKYSLDKRYWVQIADFKGGARNSGIAFAINGKGYAGLGYDGENYLKDMWQYSPDSNGWTQKNDFGGTPRMDAVAFALNNKGYVATGYNDNYLKDNWQYDPASDTWTEKAGVAGAKRKEACVFILNNQAYVVSGNNNGSALNDLEVYDPNADMWTAKRKLTNATDSSFDDLYTSIVRWNAVAFTMNNKAYLATGENGSLNTHTWEYDYTTDLWTEKTGFEGTARTGAVAFTLKNRGFVLTGRNGTNPFDNMYEFQPDVPVNPNDN
jgi:N-acetylneuraminic acid mutarotase